MKKKVRIISTPHKTGGIVYTKGAVPRYDGGGGVKKGDKKVLPKQQQEVRTTNYIPPMEQFRTSSNAVTTGAPWEGKPMYINPYAGQQEVARTAESQRSALSKAGQVARHPMTAASYVVKGQPIPDYLEYGEKNAYDNAIDIINPLTYYDAGKRVVTAEHFRNPNTSVGEAIGLTALDAAMVYGVGRGVYNKYSPKSYQRVSASGVESGEHLGSFNDKGDFVRYTQEPKNVVNSSEFEKTVQEMGAEARSNAQAYERAYKEWSSTKGRLPIEEQIRHGYSRPSPTLHDMLGYRLEEIAKTNRYMPGIAQRPTIQEQQYQEQQSGVPFHLNNSVPQQVPQKQQIKATKKSIKQQPQIQHIGSGNFTVLEDADGQQNMYHFNTREEADAMVNKRQYKDGGPINYTKGANRPAVDNTAYNYNKSYADIKERERSEYPEKEMQNVRDFFKSYADSDAYRNRMDYQSLDMAKYIAGDDYRRSIYDGIYNTQAMRNDNQGSVTSKNSNSKFKDFIGLDSVENALLNPNNGNALYGPVYAHELSHRTGYSYNPMAFIRANKRLREDDKLYNKIIDDVTGNSGRSPAAQLNYLNKNFNLDHDNKPTENHSDLDAFRYLLHKHGYLKNSWDLNKEQFQKIKNDKRINSDFNYKRLLNTFSEDDIIRLNNTQASTVKSKLPIAQKGGLIGYTNMSTRAQPTTTQMPVSQPQYSTGEQWYIDHPGQYMNPAPTYTPYGKQTHEYQREQKMHEAGYNPDGTPLPLMAVAKSQWATQGSGLVDKINTADMLIDPMHMAVGAGILVKGVGKAGMKALGKKGIKSEINWAKWNPEIPANKELMKEYHSIEQGSKANGTWLKNPDGSPFSGTPEQFVQQNSENFKKAFGNTKIRDEYGNPLILHHGSMQEFSAFVPPKYTGNSNTGYEGEYSFFTPNRGVAEHYQGDAMGSYGNYGKNSNNVKSVYINSENPLIDPRTEFPEDLIPLKERQGHDAILASLDPNPEKMIEVAVPYGNNVKSATGNNGMFNMKSRNIYKGLIPLGVGAAAMQDKQYGGKIYKNGGDIDYTDIGKRKSDVTTTQVPQPYTPPTAIDIYRQQHPEQYMRPGAQQGTPQQQRDHDYLRNKMYQQEAEERANREFAQKMTPGSELAEKFMNAEMLMSGTGMVNKGLRGISKKVAKKMADDIMPYSGNFPAAYTKGAKGNTPMPTITEVPPLSAEDKVYQSFGITPRTNFDPTTGIGNGRLTQGADGSLTSMSNSRLKEDPYYNFYNEIYKGKYQVPKGDEYIDPISYMQKSLESDPRQELIGQYMVEQLQKEGRGHISDISRNQTEPIAKVFDYYKSENKYGGSIQYQQSGSVTNNNTMKKRYKITGVPEMAGGGDTRAAWNQAHRGVAPTRAWDHDKFRSNAGVSGVQQDVANLSSGTLGKVGQMAVNTPNGISAVDDWEGYKTGAYKFRPIQYQSMKGNTLTGSKDYGYNYEQAIAENSNGKWWDSKPWQANDQNIPMNAPQSQVDQIVAYQRPVYNPRTQQGNWHTNEATDYSIDGVRTMAYGGNIPGTYNQLDTAWNYGKSLSAMYDKDPYQLKDVIPAADENSDPNNLIVIEKDEVVLQPNNGRIQAQKASTGSHASGNDKTVEVKDGSFILSDTNELKIKDKGLHRTYGLKPKASGYTPAKLVTKDVNRLNEANKILANPASDKDSRRTAQLTVDSLMKERIQPVVAMQEQMKQMKGIASPGQQYAGGGPYADKSSVVFLPEEDTASLPEYTVSAKRPGNVGQPDGPVYLPTPTANYLPQTVPVSQPTNMQAGKQESGVGDSMGSMEGTGNPPPNNPRFTRPDQLNIANSMLNYATLQKFLPYEPPVIGVIPETVYMDDTRARAAVSEQANSAYRQAAMNRGSGKLANFLAIQGQAGKQAADVAGQYANMNTQIANTANQQAAGITNQILEGQRNRLKSLHQGNTIAAQEYANEERKARGEIVNSYNTAWKNRAGYQNINEMAEHFAYDPSTGYVKFHSDGDRVEYIKKLANSGTGSQFKSPKEVYDYLVSQNIKEDDASKSAAQWAEINTFNMKDKTQSTSKVGNTKKVATIAGKKFGGLHKFFRNSY